MSPGDHLKIYVVFPTKNMRPNVYNNESYYGSTMAIFKVMADCKNKFNSNHNVLKNICFTK
jgi:hypothetical protein